MWLALSSTGTFQTDSHSGQADQSEYTADAASGVAFFLSVSKTPYYLAHQLGI